MHTSRPRGGRQHEQLAACGMFVSKQSFVQRSLHSHFTTLPPPKKIHVFSEGESNSKHWFTTSFLLGGRCRKAAMLGVWGWISILGSSWFFITLHRTKGFAMLWLAEWLFAEFWATVCASNRNCKRIIKSDSDIVETVIFWLYKISTKLFVFLSFFLSFFSFLFSPHGIPAYDDASPYQVGSRDTRFSGTNDTVQTNINWNFELPL